MEILNNDKAVVILAVTVLCLVCMFVPLSQTQAEITKMVIAGLFGMAVGQSLKNGQSPQ